MKWVLLPWILWGAAWAAQPTSTVVGLNPAQIGQPVRLRALVTGGKFGTVSGGTVAFLADGAVISGCESAALEFSYATCSTAFPRLGPVTIRTDYSGTADWAPSSATAFLEVGKAAPSCYIESNPHSAIYGRGLIVNALVLGAENVPAPTGTFTFMDNGAPLVVRTVGADGYAAMDTPLTAGSHLITAAYSGDQNYLPSPPVRIVILVAKGTPIVAISSTPPQISQPTTITVSVLPAGAGGTVTFTGVPDCGASPLHDGVATCATTLTRLGEVTVSAAYSGDQNLDAGSASMKLSVGKAAPGLYAAFIPESPVFGDGVLLGALVSPAPGLPPPGGTVAFTENGTSLVPPVPFDQPTGHLTVRLPLNAGPHTLQAHYSGDANYQPAGPVTLNVTVARATPVLAISSTPGQIDQPVAVTASVTPASATGSIDFSGIPGCGLTPLAGGKAVCNTVFRALGAVTLKAVYTGDGNVNGAVASTTLKVGKAVAGVYLAHTPAAPVVGEPVRMNVLVQAARGVPAPAGSVSFNNWIDVPAHATLDADGRASWTAAFPAGPHPVLATFEGDANYGSSSAADAIVVAKGNTSTVLGPTGATVTAAPPATGVPTGSVRFLRGGALLGVIPLTNGAAPMAGADTAEYLGDGNFNGSAGAAALARPALTLSADRNPAPAGMVGLTATLPATATGSVTFSSNGEAFGVATVAAGIARCTATLAPGSYTVTAAYSGDGAFSAADATLSLVVTSAPLFSIRSAPASPVFGQPVTLSVQLPSGASGAVQFFDSGVPIGSSSPAQSGDTVLSVVTLGAGDHHITATWAGSTAEASVTVAKGRSAVAVSVTAGVANARVVAAPPAAGQPSGTVRFVDAASNVVIAAAVLAGGTASAGLPLPSPPVRAEYDGDANFLPAVSNAAGELSIANAASYAFATFAPDEIVTLFGPGLAGDGPATVTDSASVRREGKILYRAADQASLVLPAELAPGPALLTISGMTGQLSIASSAPGLFTTDATGSGAPAGQAVIVRSGGGQDTAPAAVVDLDGSDAVYLVLYATGIRHSTSVTCSIGGNPAPVIFAGPQGDFAGLDQVNILLPASLKGAGRVDLVLTADGAASNAVSIEFR